MSIRFSGTISAEIDVSDYDHDIDINIDYASDLIELGESCGITQEEMFEYIVDGEIMAHLNTNLVCTWLEDHCPVESFAKIIAVAAAQLQNMINLTEQQNAELRQTVANYRDAFTKQAESGELSANNLSS